MKKLSASQKIQLWLDSFPLDLCEKESLISSGSSPSELIRNFETVFKSVIKPGKESVYNNMAKSLTDNGKYFADFTKKLDSLSVSPIFKDDEEYPKELLSLDNAPFVLYAKGNTALLKEEKFAVVGSRHTTDSALKLGEELAKDVSEEFTVITGIATGGDLSAINGAKKGSGKVIMVLAGGFNEMPTMNYNDILSATENGLILSPFPFYSPTLKYSYEVRNLYIATMAKGGLILSAGEKSGTLITAKYLKKQNKQIFAVPYFPNVVSGRGCNALIKDGAILTENSEDVFKFYGIEKSETVKEEISLTPDEEKIMAAFENESEISLSKVAIITGIPVYKLGGIVTAMEIKGLIIKTAGNCISKTVK